MRLQRVGGDRGDGTSTMVHSVLVQKNILRVKNMLLLSVAALTSLPTCGDLKSLYRSSDCCGAPDNVTVPVGGFYDASPCWNGRTYTAIKDTRLQDGMQSFGWGGTGPSLEAAAWAALNGYLPERACRKQGGTWDGEIASCAITGPYEFPNDDFATEDEAIADWMRFHNCTGSPGTGDPTFCETTLAFDADGRAASLFGGVFRMCATRTGQHSVLLKLYTLMNLLTGGDVDPCAYTPAAVWNSPQLFGALFDATPEQTLFPAVVAQVAGVYQAGKLQPYYPPDVPDDKKTPWDWAGSTLFHGFQFELFFDETCVPRPATPLYRQNDPATFATGPHPLRNGQPIADQPYWFTHVIDRPGTPGHGLSHMSTTPRGTVTGRWDDWRVDWAVGQLVFSPP